MCVCEVEFPGSGSREAGRGGSLIKELKLLGTSPLKASTTPLLSSNKIPLISDEGKLQRWHEHFASVVNCCSSVSQLTLEYLPALNPPEEFLIPLPGDDNNSLCAPLSEEEIAIALSQTKSGEAPGPDGISVEILKVGGSAFIQWLETVADQVWEDEVVLTDWHKQLIIPLHKKGNRSECDNYRGIALLNTPSKVLCRALLNCLKHLVRPFSERVSVAFAMCGGVQITNSLSR